MKKCLAGIAVLLVAATADARIGLSFAELRKLQPKFGKMWSDPADSYRTAGYTEGNLVVVFFFDLSNIARGATYSTNDGARITPQQLQKIFLDNEGGHQWTPSRDPRIFERSDGKVIAFGTQIKGEETVMVTNVDFEFLAQFKARVTRGAVQLSQGDSASGGIQSSTPQPHEQRGISITDIGLKSLPEEGSESYAYFTWKARLTNNGDNDLRDIKATLTLLDPEGYELDTDHIYDIHLSPQESKVISKKGLVKAGIWGRVTHYRISTR